MTEKNKKYKPGTWIVLESTQKYRGRVTQVLDSSCAKPGYVNVDIDHNLDGGYFAEASLLRLANTKEIQSEILSRAN